MKNGARPTKQHHKDKDFHKSFGSVLPSQFPSEYLCDAGLSMPNQEELDVEFTPAVPPMPFGCTNEASADLATDLTGKLYNPYQLENITHANAKGGYDIRLSLQAARDNLHWFKDFYNVQKQPILDWFDSLRLAQFVGAPEKRSLSIGTPWFPSWEKAAVAGIFVMPAPTNEELAAIAADDEAYSWHDSKLDGWCLENGTIVYRDKSWQGRNVGRGGFIAFDRATINTVMQIRGTVAFTSTNLVAPESILVQLSGIQWLLSRVRSILASLGL